MTSVRPLRIKMKEERRKLCSLHATIRYVRMPFKMVAPIDDIKNMIDTMYFSVQKDRNLLSGLTI